MAGYAITNLKEVEDSAPKFGLSPALEARFPRGELGFEGIGLSYQRLAPNARQPFGHRHREQEEVYVVVGGSGRVNVDGEVHEVREWDAIRVAPGTARAFEADGDGLAFVAFGTSTGGFEDVESLPGWWGGEKTGPSA
jgi:mannose-6-phosphate isomerase-like protein (cupin superfamily)